MTPERWQQVRKLLLSALERGPEARSVFLAQVCADDLSLRREVESLIASYEEDENFLEAPALDAAKLLSEGSVPSMVGRFIGPYKVIGELGHGGMGTVYLAMRADDQYRKQVAIKLVRRGMDTEDILSRFRHERQILASLDHPNIARLIDGGTTEDGLPYFVMEYIEGQTIDQYCDTHKLSTVERLKLFRMICSAVHYAHQNLVVHRDIKPGNILVTSDGVPKLLDFGIAKLLNPALYAQTFAPTVTAMRPMTPDYASPEQVRGQPITTATDIYSLGVLLYELLTGHRPYQIKTTSPQEIERVICEQEPEKPSTAINRAEEVTTSDGTTQTVTPESVSRTREGAPDKLRRKLTGDLDNIVLMAMRKEPRRRYASVGQFSEDIRRHLEGLPVIARKDTFGYRTGKFIKRHKVGVAVAAAFVVLIISFGVIAAMQSARLARERDKAARERDKAEQVSAFMADLFKAPSQAKGNTITAREILDKGAERINKELKEQPEVQAQLMDTIGFAAYHSLGLYDSSAAILEKSLAIRRQLLGNEHLDVATSLDHLAEARQAQGNYGAAESLFRECLAIRSKLLGNEHEAVSETLNDLAYVLKVQGKYAEAEPLYREALALRRKLIGNENEAVAWALNNLAQLLRAKGDDEAAEPLLREALEIFRQRLGEEHDSVATTLNNLGSLLRDKGDYTAAEPMLRQALEIWRKIMPSDEHPNIAYGLSNLGMLLHAKGDAAAAEPVLREALAMRSKLLGAEHPLVATSQYNLAVLLHDKGNYAAAEALYRQALQLRHKALPKGHPETALSLLGLGRLLTERGDPHSAEALLREALEIQRRTLPQSHWQVADAESVLGGCLAALKRYDEAEPLLIESYSVLKAKRGEGNRQTQQALARLINLYKAWGKPDKAAQYHAGNGSK